MIAHSAGSQRQASLPAHTAHREQVLHHSLRGKATRTDLLLDRLRNLPHQAQVPRHPARAPAQPPRDLLTGEAVALAQLIEEPAVLECARYSSAMARPLDEQRLRHRQRPHHHRNQIAAQSTQRAKPLVAVDHHEPVPVGHHYDRDLLAALAKSSEKPPLHPLATGAQRLEPLIELVKLHFHGRGHEDRSARIWSFRSQGPCRLDPPILERTYSLIWPFRSPRACRPDSSALTRTCTAIWSFACLTRTRPNSARNTAAAAVKSSCATSHGRRSSGARGCGASGRSATRCCKTRYAVTYSGFRFRHDACVADRRRR